MSLSCGAQVIMDFRHPSGSLLSVLLPPRSLLVMSGDSRYFWSHAITPRKSDIVPTDAGGLTLAARGVRTSFTFRKLSATAGILPPEKESFSVMPRTDKEASALESHHVHQVYEEIADHFSDTRHKPWPQIAEFLSAQRAGSILVDIGCGNGKYFTTSSHLYQVGSDRSENLASICRSRGFQVFVGDVLSIPLRSGAVDVALCIAVIHHLSTQERRKRAVRELVRILTPGGRALIYVWAQEQEKDQRKSKYLTPRKECKRGSQSSTNTDSNSADMSFVKAEISSEANIDAREDTPSKDVHMSSSFGLPDSGPEQCEVRCELDKSCDTLSESLDAVTHIADSQPQQHSCDAKTRDIVSFSEDTDSASKSSFKINDNEKDSRESVDKGEDASGDRVLSRNSQHEKPTPFLQIHTNRTEFKQQDLLVPWQLKKGKVKGSAEGDASQGQGRTFQRFYHVFQAGELEALCADVSDCRVRRSYYDQGNWCVVLEKASS